MQREIGQHTGLFLRAETPAPADTTPRQRHTPQAAFCSQKNLQ